MHKAMNRRDFLKLLSLLPPAIYMAPNKILEASVQNADSPNIIVLVFDTWSAPHISLYGYPRKTTPNLDRLAERAIVYHNHYANGHFTVPGTASLLTGVQPWTHHLYQSYFSFNEEFQQKNLFGIFPEYHRWAYTHNPLAHDILLKMTGQLDHLKPREDLYLTDDVIAKIFQRDFDIASVSWIRTMETYGSGYANSVFFSRLWSWITSDVQRRLEDEFPYGVPKFSESNVFILEDAIDWLASHQEEVDTPSLTYFHLLPPHFPYNTRQEFVDAFESDDYIPTRKPEHVFSEGISDKDNAILQRHYDEYIGYVDAEIGRLFSLLEQSPRFENTWVILTSDHGEVFERGMRGHAKPNMYQSLLNIPLLIFPPGQQKRVDVFEPTAAIDILPTLLNMTGREVPAWMEGMVLPPWNQNYPADRSIFVVDAKFSTLGNPYANASLMLRKGSDKLIHHFGQTQYYKPIKGSPLTELYDLSLDPEELENRFEKDAGKGAQLLDELLEKLRGMGLYQ